MVLLNRCCSLLVVVFSLFLISCDKNSDKSKAQRLNEDRFSDSEVTRDANFLVNAIDESYAILEIAEMGIRKLTDPEHKRNAREIAEAQASVAVKLKSFAEHNEIAIPLSGPAKSRSAVDALTSMQGRKFEQEWSKQMKLHHQRLINDLSKYKTRAPGPLRNMLDSTLVVMNENKQRILALTELDGD